ncbi:MAG TPA: Gfo/Idh/MocA family oxidoreductase [Saprospiraceae bacterium]|nr:Gfo/Idh/MocA family oxidoreductase [Saprospiraceae bacterium]
MRKVRWGILSTARINRRLIPELHASERCQLIAVASRDLRQAKDYAEIWNIPRPYGNYEALLADKDIDVVYISLPNDLHMTWTVRALHAGKHVLCEKPLCLSEDEFKKIALASEETGKSVMEAFMYMHHPQTAHFKKLIDEGEIGEVVSLYSEFASTFNRQSDNYRMSATKGGGALWDIGVYPVSFFRYLISSPVLQVNAKARIEGGIDKSFWGRIDFATDITGQFYVSFESIYSTRTSIMGTTGRLDISHPYNAISECKASLTKEDEVREIILPQASLYAGEVENMNDVVLRNETPRFTIDDSAKVLELILVLRKDAGME